MDSWVTNVAHTWGTPRKPGAVQPHRRVFERRELRQRRTKKFPSGPHGLVLLITLLLLADATELVTEVHHSFEPLRELFEWCHPALDVARNPGKDSRWIEAL